MKFNHSNVEIAQQDNFSILHLSDIHFGNRDPRNEMGRISEALIAAAHTSNTVPDICVFSGDMAFSGDVPEFAAGTKWLKNLLEPWPDTKIFVVPGNHDIVRIDANLLLRQAYESEELFDQEKNKLGQKLQHLDGFCQWIEELKNYFGSRLLSTWEDRFVSSASFQLYGRKIRFVGLNTALLSCGNDDIGKLVQDVSKLNGALPTTIDESELVVAVGHHPLDWLVPWNRTEVERLLKQRTGAHIYMHGHRHQAATMSFGNGAGENLTTLEGGAAYQGSQWPQYFALHTLAYSRREILPSTFALAPSSGKWIFYPELSEPFIASIPQALPDARTRESSLPEFDDPATLSADNSIDIPTHERIELDAHRALEATRSIFTDLVSTMDDAIGKSVAIYGKKNRTKEFDSIIRKVSTRLVKGDPAYSVGALEDICGLRYSVMFQSDLPLLIERLLEIAFTRRNPIFRYSAGAKVTIHTSRPENDPLAITNNVKEVFERSNVAHRIEIRQRDTGYSSVHIVLRHVAKRWAGDKDGIPVEFQLRTGLEEYWGQLDTKLRYSVHRGAVDDHAWQKHLNVLKTQFDAMIQYVDLIRETARTSDLGQRSKGKNYAQGIEHGESSLSFSTSDGILNELAALPENIMSRLKEAYTLWESADASRQFGGVPSRYRKAADAFEALAEMYTFRIKDEALRRQFHYRMNMERAYLLLYTEDARDVAIASDIYSELLAERPNDATIHLRLGQVKMANREFETANTYFEAAAKNAPIEAQSGSNEEMMRILDFALLNKGLCNFRIFEESPKGQAGRAAISVAIRSAQAVVKAGHGAEVRENAMNDMVYYAWEERKTNAGHPPTLSDDEYDRYSNELIDSVTETLKTAPNFRLGDTLVRILSDRKRVEEAREAADLVCTLLEKAAKERNNQNLLADSPKYGSKWTSKISAALRNEDERDAFFFSIAIRNMSS